MNILQSILLGIVEGLTEFLPISSTFHLIITSRLVGLHSTDFLKLFEVVIQSGAIGAVIILYARTLIHDHLLLSRVLLSFLPTAIVGLVLHSIIKQIFFESIPLMLTVFAGVGIIFLLIEKSHFALTKQCESLTSRDALIIGLAQACSVIPGVSRSGAVIVCMMLLGYKRDQAALYTFYLSLPTILSATAFDLYQERSLLITYENGWLLLGVGFFTALITALVVVKWLIQYLSHNSLALFGWYRIVLATTLLATMVIA